MLITVCGLQGVGKSVVSSYLAQMFPAVLLRTDVIRTELFGRVILPGKQYPPEMVESVYDEMFRRASERLQEGPVVLDGMFYTERHRAAAAGTAAQANSPHVLIKVLCSDDEAVRKRMEARVGDASTAGFSHYLIYKKLFEPIANGHYSVDNTGSHADTQAQLDAILLRLRP